MNIRWGWSPPPSSPAEPKPGDRYPGRCTKCGNERRVVWQVTPETLRVICKLCGKELEVKR